MKSSSSLLGSDASFFSWLRDSCASTSYSERKSKSKSESDIDRAIKNLCWKWFISYTHPIYCQMKMFSRKSHHFECVCAIAWPFWHSAHKQTNQKKEKKTSTKTIDHFWHNHFQIRRQFIKSISDVSKNYNNFCNWMNSKTNKNKTKWKRKHYDRWKSELDSNKRYGRSGNNSHFKVIIKIAFATFLSFYYY